MTAKKTTGSKAKISKGMTLGELVAKHPETVDVMLKYGLHCVGCHMAALETIEQGALAHGMDANEDFTRLRGRSWSLDHLHLSGLDEDICPNCRR